MHLLEGLSNDEKEKRSSGVAADCRTEISFFLSEFLPEERSSEYRYQSDH